MGYQPDPANQPAPPLDNYDSASETSPPIEEVVGLEGRSAEPDPAQDGPGIYPWDEVDAEGRRVPRRSVAKTGEAEPGAATTYNAGYSDRSATP
jgi:hypothetical protein